MFDRCSIHRQDSWLVTGDSSPAKRKPSSQDELRLSFFGRIVRRFLSASSGIMADGLGRRNATCEEKENPLALESGSHNTCEVSFRG
jgi:hypothetical protein